MYKFRGAECYIEMYATCYTKVRFWSYSYDQKWSGSVWRVFWKFDGKELFGICNYDAIACVPHNEEHSLVIIEVILASLLQNELVNLSVILVSDWLVRQKIDYTRSCICERIGI